MDNLNLSAGTVHWSQSIVVVGGYPVHCHRGTSRETWKLVSRLLRRKSRYLAPPINPPIIWVQEPERG